LVNEFILQTLTSIQTLLNIHFICTHTHILPRKKITMHTHTHKIYSVVQGICISSETMWRAIVFSVFTPHKLYIVTKVGKIQLTKKGYKFTKEGVGFLWWCRILCASKL
jgi:hypothetical protein